MARTLPGTPDVPVIVLSPHTHEPDLLRAFEAGTDDFLAHPPNYLELRARLRAILRRAGGSRSAQVLRVGPLTIDTDAHTARLDDKHLDLRRWSTNCSSTSLATPGAYFRKQELLLAVWGYPVSVSTRTIDSHASRLRGKLAARGERWIINTHGVGYRLL